MPRLFPAVCFTAAFLAAALACPHVRADDKPKHSVVVQTFEPARNNGTPLVQVRFSNTLVGTFAIDTGEFENVITEPFAKKAGMSLAEDSQALLFGLHHVMFVQPPEIKLENLTVLKPPFRVVSQDFLPPFNGRPIDGILGGSFLAQFALRIDYPAHEIDWITPGNLSGKEAAAFGFTSQNLVELGQERLPGSIIKVNHYSVRTDFQNAGRADSEDLTIDTGAPSTMISSQLAETLHLSSQGVENMATLSVPSAVFNRSTAAQMQIGPLLFSDIAVISPQRKDSSFPSLLGENVLSNCVVLFDFGPHRFYLKPVLPPAKEVGTSLVDKKQIVWDRLRAAPDLPTVEDMLRAGFASDAQDSLSEQAASLQSPAPAKEAVDTIKEVERLEKLGAVRRFGQDEVGAKAALAQAVALAKASALAHPSDGAAAGRWAEALIESGRVDESAAAAVQTTVRLPQYAPGWQNLGTALTVQVYSVLTGGEERLTESNAPKLIRQQEEKPLTAAQAAETQRLLTQAHAAFDRALALDPTDAESYENLALFRLVSRAALSAMQEAGQKVTLPPQEVPSVETALALAVADWQQWGTLSKTKSTSESLSESESRQDAVTVLREVAILDRLVPHFHDRSWLAAHLKNTSAVLPQPLLSAEAIEANLTQRTQSQDKTLAASAWTALGTVQAGSSDVSGSTASGASHAENSWRQALALDPAQSDALTALASRLKSDGQWSDLTSLLTRQTTVHDTVPTRLTLACVLSGEGLPAAAETQVRAAKSLAPNNATVNLVLADLLLARSSGDPAALAEAAACLAQAKTGYGTLATAEQEATLTTSEAVWLALDHDPDAAEKQLAALARKQPNCTQVREALAALVPY